MSFPICDNYFRFKFMHTEHHFEATFNPALHHQTADSLHSNFAFPATTASTTSFVFSCAFRPSCLAADKELGPFACGQAVHTYSNVCLLYEQQLAHWGKFQLICLHKFPEEAREDFEVCFWSLSCCKRQTFAISFWTI